MPKAPRRGRGANKKPKEGFGRPHDHKLEAFFMKKLRNGKIQVINTESEAQLCCHQHPDCKPKGKAKKSQVRQSEDDAIKKIEYVRNWFSKIDTPHFALLWTAFKQAALRWEWTEVHSEKDFGDYLFLDECDLTYILHSLLHSNEPDLRDKITFTNSELLYFELLGFATRDMISFKVLRNLEKHNDLVIAMMEGLKEKAKEHYEKKRDAMSEEEEKSEEEEVQEGQEENIFSMLVLPDQEYYFEQESVKEKKKKMIQKQEKKDEKKKPKQTFDSQSEDIQIEQLKELVKKMISHIAWSYRYIYPEEIKKRSRLNRNQ